MTTTYTSEKVLEGSSSFDCLVLAIAYLRQILRHVLDGDKNLKLYDRDAEGLFEITLNDVFLLHDCIPEDMMIAYEWAKKNGYQSE